MSHSHQNKDTLVCGTGLFAIALAKEISARPECGYHIVGLVAENEDTPDCNNYPLLGNLDQLQDIIAKTKPARIIVCLSQKRHQLPVYHLIEAKVCGSITVENGDEVYERLTGKIAIEALTPSSIIFSEDFKISRVSKLASRLMSLFFSSAGILILSPFFLLIPLLIKIDSKGAVFFIQERVGINGKKFNLFKFRTMHPSEGKTSEWAGDNVSRITRVGNILRKFRLDELPQFINVLKGDMNIVGPRPHPASNYEMFVLVSRNTPVCGWHIPYYSLRCIVRPGITGWAQVKYQYANNLHEEMEKLCFDLYYVKHYSLWLDICILFETIKVVLKGHSVEDSKQHLPGLDYEVKPVTKNVYPVLVQSKKADFPARKNINSTVPMHKV